MLPKLTSVELLSLSAAFDYLMVFFFFFLFVVSLVISVKKLVVHELTVVMTYETALSTGEGGVRGGLHDHSTNSFPLTPQTTSLI